MLLALAEIARGRNVGTELHNVSAHRRNLEALVGSDAAVMAAGVEVARAAAQLAAAAERSGGLIERGLNPPELEASSRAVERWRVASLEALAGTIG